jgi:hypothetical protein
VSSQRECKRFVKAGQLAGVPFHPSRTYEKEWGGWGDFLGTGRVATQHMQLLSFCEARKVVRLLRLKNQREFIGRARAGQLKGVPSDPRKTYRDAWTNWQDFLGTNNTRLTFEEAVKVARTFGVKTRREYAGLAKDGRLPEGMPSDPRGAYKGEWRGWGDFLGFRNMFWTKNSMLVLLSDIRSQIPHLLNTDLYMVLQDMNLTAALKQTLGVHSLKEVLSALRGDDLEDRIRRSTVLEGDSNDNFNGTVEEMDGIEEDTRAPITHESLRAADALFAHGVAARTIERLNISKLAGLRVKYVSEGRQAVEQVLAGDGGSHFCTLRRSFLHEIGEVEALQVPQWKLNVNGQNVQPNRMQRYTAARMLRSQHWCNWSTTGAVRRVVRDYPPSPCIRS